MSRPKAGLMTPAPLSYRATYDVLGYRASVAANQPMLIELLDRLLSAFRCADDRPPTAHYEAIGYPDQPLWELLVDGVELGWREQELAAAGEIEWHIVDQAIERRRDLLHAHGAIVAGRQGSLLIPGASGIGKTTLALALRLHGLQLYADDVVLLDPIGRRPLPFPRALHVHDDALARLTALGLRYRPEEHLGAYLCASALAPWPTQPGPPLGWVIVLAEPRPDGPTQLEPIYQAEAAVELLRVSKNLDQQPRRGLDQLAHLFQSVACYRLQRATDPALAARLIAELIAEAPAPPAPTTNATPGARPA